jgi:hypothetical protein
MKMIGRATNPEVLRASTQASFRNTGAAECTVACLGSRPRSEWPIQRKWAQSTSASRIRIGEVIGFHHRKVPVVLVRFAPGDYAEFFDARRSVSAWDC